MGMWSIPQCHTLILSIRHALSFSSPEVQIFRFVLHGMWVLPCLAHVVFLCLCALFLTSVPLAAVIIRTLRCFGRSCLGPPSLCWTVDYRHVTQITRNLTGCDVCHTPNCWTLEQADLTIWRNSFDEERSARYSQLWHRDLWDYMLNLCHIPTSGYILSPRKFGLFSPLRQC